jgi:hypothetical protein
VRPNRAPFNQSVSLSGLSSLAPSAGQDAIQMHGSLEAVYRQTKYNDRQRGWWGAER